MTENFDLFGNPDRPGRGAKGRPPFEVTDKDRNKVKLLLALGWGNQRIANAIAVSPATLKRYFRAELKVRDAMRDRLEARRLEIAMDLATYGNVAALKELGKMIERSDLMGLASDLRADQDDDRKEVKLGKKDRAIEAARTAGEGSHWGSDLLPGVLKN